MPEVPFTDEPRLGSHRQHANRNRSDNRWDNLRDATPSENGGNKGVSKNNKLHIKGVSRTPSGKFRADIRLNRKNTYLGRFDTAESAAAAYATAAENYFGEFACYGTAANDNQCGESVLAA
jgi:hypothetical protein